MIAGDMTENENSWGTKTTQNASTGGWGNSGQDDSNTGSWGGGNTSVVQEKSSSGGWGGGSAPPVKESSNSGAWGGGNAPGTQENSSSGAWGSENTHVAKEKTISSAWGGGGASATQENLYSSQNEQKDDSRTDNEQKFSISERGPRPEPTEEQLHHRNYNWASNRTRYEFSDNDLDEQGFARRDESLEKELFGEIKESQGIDFSNYNKIPVRVERGQAPPPISTFAEASLHPVMKDNLRLANYAVPTPVQTAAIPIVINGHDLMACAQTGSGKTAAFLVPTLSALFQNAKDLQKPKAAPYEYRTYMAEPLVLILAPTRELCSQIFDECRKFTYRSSLRPCAVYGGADAYGQLRQLERGCDILAASPGRLMDFIQRGKLGLGRIKYLILDEADRMLDMGFEAVIRNIIQKNQMNDGRQTLLFSATFPREIRALARDFLKPNYLFLKVGRVGGTSTSITQKVIYVEEEDKRTTLITLLKQQPPTRILIFVETKRSADSLDQYLFENKLPSTSIHGDRTQMEREDALLAFKSATCPILVATAVAARGIDVRGVMHVINYDMPKDIDEYIHRIGRTARVGAKGLATSFYNSGSDLLATDLTKLLKECQQEIPEFLESYVTEDMTFENDLDDKDVTAPSYAGQEYIPLERNNPAGGTRGVQKSEEAWNESAQHGDNSGDWNCSSCSASNYASRRACFKCHTSKTGGDGGDSGYSRNTNPNDWDCPDCQRSNFASRYECFKCHASRPEGAGGGGDDRRNQNSRPGDWSCTDCNQNNFASRYECFKCGTSKPEGLPEVRRESRPRRDTDWDCTSCSGVNFGNRTECFKCHAPKEGGNSNDYGGQKTSGYDNTSNDNSALSAPQWDSGNTGWSTSKTSDSNVGFGSSVGWGGSAPEKAENSGW